jgi:hypothetical protein
MFICVVKNKKMLLCDLCVCEVEFGDLYNFRTNKFFRRQFLFSVYLREKIVSTRVD